MGADQPFNAERCLAIGAALSAPLPQETDIPGQPLFTPSVPTDIRNGLRRLLSESGFPEAARAAASEIAEMPPLEVAAQQLEAVVRERSRQTTTA